MESHTNVISIALKDEQPLGDVTFLSRQWRFTASFLEDAKHVTTESCSALGAMLGPLSLIAYVFAFWRLAADIGWSGPFVIAAGFFSHWIVWFSIGLALTLCAALLKRQPAPARACPRLPAPARA